MQKTSARLPLVLAACFITLAQWDCTAQNSNYFFESLTTEQGLSSNKVEAVLQDREGFYWIATQNGLNRFDGTTFKIFRHDANDSTSLTHNYCTALVEGNNGDIWVATYKGVSRYIKNKGFFQNIYLQNPVKNFEITNHIYDITLDETGNVWMAGNGLWKYDIALDSIILFQPDETNAASLSDNGLLTHLVYDKRNHGIWLTTGSELNFLNLRENNFYRAGHNPQHWKVFDFADARELAIDSLNRLWFRDKATQQLSFFEFDKNQITNTGKKVNYGIKQICADPVNRIWIFYWLGRAEIYSPETATTDTTFFAVHHQRSMISEKANSLFVDQENNYWISTDNGIGLYNVGNQYYKLHQLILQEANTPKDPLKIKALAQTEEGILWIATNLGLVKYDLKTGKYKRLNIDMPISNITTLCADGNVLWIGVYDQLLAMDTKSETLVKNLHLRPGIFFIRKGDPGELWVGLWSGGLYKINIASGEQLYFSKNTEGTSSLRSDNLITGFFDDEKFWIGYNAGVGFSEYSISSNTFKHYHPQENDMSNSNAGTITVITKDHSGLLWLGTYGSGVFTYDPVGHTFENYQQPEGLRSNYINSILPDEKGNLWISTADGLNFFNFEKQRIRQLTMDLVFPDNDFVANGITGLNGKLYFFCRDAFVEVDPSAYLPDPKFPKLVISSFKVFDREMVLPGGQNKINLSYRENFFSFQYSAIRTNPRKEVRTAYKLEGFDRDWNIAGNQPYAGYTNVPDGTYQFKVKVMNDEGQWSDTAVHLDIHISPPYWRTWWFVLICVTALITGIYLIYRNRVGQIKRIFSMRTRISQDLHDDVGASLSSIQIYSAVAEKEMKDNPEKAREIVQQINENSRQVMENMSDIVWAMNTGRPDGESLAGRLKNYGYDLLSQKNIDCHYRIDPQAEKRIQKPDARKNILLIIKEALNNIAKYSEASQAEIQITLEGSYVFIRISDNGKGFDMDRVQSGNGLRNMKQRAEALGGNFSIRSSTAAGTNIECRIPLTNISDR